MENSNVEQKDRDTQCIYCKNKDSIFGMCKSFHFVCQECQTDFQTCPICFGEYLPFDDLLMETVVSDVNYAKTAENKCNVESMEKVLENRALHLPRKKKEPIDECKDSFFLGVWDIVTSSLFSPNRNVTFRQFLGTTCTKISKRMGNALLSLASTKENKSSVVPISVGLLLLVISSQLLFRNNNVGRVSLGQKLVLKTISNKST